MAMDDLRAALQANANDTRTFQTHLEPILREGTREQFDEFLDTVLSAVSSDEAVANLMRAADFKAKSVAGPITEYVIYRIGHVFLDRIRNEDMAEMFFRRLPAESELAASLHDFYVTFFLKKENWRKLEQLFQQEAQAEGAADPAAESKRRAARLAQEKGNEERALAYWQALRKELPEDDEAGEELIRLYRKTGKWHQVAEMLRIKAESLPASEVQQQIAIYQELIPIYRDHLKMEAKAAAAYQAILKLQPDNDEAFRELCGQFASSGRWPDLVKLLKGQVEATSDPRKAFALHKEIAEIMEVRFSNAMEAMRSYEAMLEIAPDDLDVIRKLKHLYEQRRDWGKYVDVARRELSYLKGSERAGMLRKLAKLALDNVREAEIGIGLWKEVREVDPEDREAFDSLMSLYERSKDFVGVAGLLEERIGQVSVEEKKQLLERLATIYSTRVQDMDQAADTWNRLLELDAENFRAKAELKKILVRAKDLDAIDSFFRMHGNAGDHTRTLETMAKEEEEPVLKVQMLFRLAELYGEAGGKDDKARAALEEILSVDAQNVEAAQKLVELYPRLECWEPLVTVQELLLAEKQDMPKEDRLELLLSKARIHEQKLDQVQEAFFTYVSAYQIDYTRSEVHREMERLADASHNWETYISVLEQTLEIMEDERDKAPYLLRIAEIWEAKLDNVESATQYYTRVLAIDESSLVAVAALGRIYKRSEQWELYRQILDRQLALESAPQERQQILLQLGEVCQVHLQDADGAIRAYGMLIAEFPSMASAYDHLCDVLHREQRYGELLDALESRLAALQPRGSELADLLVDIGMLHFSVHEDVEVAVGRYVEALHVDPEHARSVTLLEELVGNERVQLRVARALQTVYELREDRPRLADALEIELKWTEQPTDRIDLLSRLRVLYIEADNSQAAFLTVRRLLLLQPEDPSLREQFEDLAGQLDAWATVVELYGEIVELIGNFEYRHEVMRAAAGIYHMNLSDRSTAKSLYRKVLEDAPGDGASLAALQGIAFEEEDWAGLLGIYETRKDLETDAAGRISVMFDIAALCRDHLNDLEKASKTGEEILEIDSSSEEAIALLDELYSVQERWSDLLRILEAAGHLATSDSARVALLIRMAELQETKLSNREGMVDLLDMVLRIDPLSDRAVEMLERNIEGEQALRVLDLLEAHARRTARWDRLIELLSLRKGFVEDAFTQLGIQKEIARIYEEELANLTAAFENARIALALAPEDEDVLTRLLLLSENLGNFEELFLVIDEETRQMSDSAQRTQMWRVQATVARDKLADSDTAVACFRKVIEAQPDDIDSVRALGSLYRIADKYAELVEVLAIEAGLTQDIDERKVLFMEMGATYYEHLSLPDKAVAAYEEILQLSHEDATALERLESLYFETERFEELEQILQRRATLAADAAERKNLLLRRAEVLENRLERLEEAFDVLNGLFSNDPLDIDLVLRLETLHEKREDWLSLLDILRHKLELLSDSEHYPVLMKTASIYSERLTDVHQAVATYRTALLRFPGEAATVDELERIVLTFEDKREAYAVLRPLLEERADWERLLVIMEAYKDSLDEPEARLSVLLEMAAFAEDRLSAVERAFHLAAQALSLAPGREGVMDLLERVARKAGMLEQAVEVYASVAEAGDGGPEAVAMLMRKARILKDEIQDFERAVKEYQGLAELGVDRRVLEALDELYSLLERWSDLATVLREEFDLAVALDEKLLFLFRLADVYEDNLNDAHKACEVIREAHLLDTTREDTLGRLRRLFDEKIPDSDAADLLEHWYSANSRFDDVAAVLERRFALTEGTTDKLEIAQKLINVFLSKLADKRKGLHYAGEALVLGPDDYASMDQLLRLCRETGMTEETVAFLQLARVRCEETEAYRNLGMEAAGLLTSVGRSDEAEQTLREVIERDGKFLPAWKALEKLLESVGRTRDHETVLVQLIELEEYDDDRIPLLLKLGRLRRDQLNDSATAIEAFSRVVALDERNDEALNSLAALYEAGGLFEKLAETLTAMAELASEVDERVSLLVRLALLAEDKLTDIDRAVSTWLQVLDWNPNDAMVLSNLQRLYEFKEEWSSFVEMAEREAVLGSTEQERRLELRRSIARAALKHLDDSLQAQQNWEAVVEARPEDEEACAELRILYRRNEDFIKLALLLERLASNPQTFEEKRIELWVELGRLKMDEAMDPDGAIRAWKQVLDLAPRRMDAFEALERLYLDSAKFEDVVILLQCKLDLLSDDAARIALLDTVATVQEESLGRWQDAALTRLRILDINPLLLPQYQKVADIYEAQQQWQPLSEVLLRRLEVEEDAAEKIVALTRLAELYEDRLSDDRAALTVTRRALELAPGDLDLLDRGERLATRSELWEELREMWVTTVPHLDDDRRQCTKLKLGALLRDKLGRFEEAIAWFVRVVDDNPEEEQALSSLVELYELVENWPNLADSLARLAEVTSDFNRQIALYLRLGDVRFGKLKDHASAQAAYSQVLELDPTEEKAVNALQILYTETENWEKLVEILGVRASLHPEEDAQLKLIAGELLENRLNKPLDAAQLYDEIVTYDPTVSEAFARLERIYTEHEVWDQLVEAYEKRLAVTSDAEGRMDILRRLALLNESVLSNGEAAADFYQQILDVKADDREAITALERLYEEQGRFDDLVLVLRRAVQLAETVRQKVLFLEKIAGICVEKLQDSTSAIMAYREILENDPAHVETLLRLEDLFSREGDWMEVLKVLELRQKIARDVNEVVGFYLRKGDIYRDELLMPDKAREQYHMVLERIPDHADAIERLIGLYEEDEHWEKIVELLLAQARSISNEEHKARIFARMGRYMKDRLENLDGAVELFEAALERVPTLVEAVEPLAEIYMAREQWEKAFPLLEMQRQLLEQSAPADVLAALYSKVARVCLSTGNRPKALEYFRKAYDMDPTNVETLDGLASLNFAQGNYEVAEAYYKGLLDRAGDSIDNNRRNSIFRALGEIEMHLGRVDSARDYFAKVLELQPRDKECLLDLANLMGSHGDWEESVRYRRQLVNLLDDPMERWKALIGIGDVYREKMGNVDLAIRAYNEALEAQPYAKGALVKLLEIHINLKAYNEAINVLQHLVQVEENPQKKAAFTFTIATIYREELKEHEMAVDYYDQTLDLHPEKFEAFRSIDELLTERKEWESLEGAYRKMVGRIRGKGLKQVEFALYKALGEIYRSRLRKPDMATSCFELAAKLNSEDVAVHEILAQLYELQGLDEKAVAEHRSLVALEPERIESYRKMAGLFRRMNMEDDAFFAMSVLAMSNKLNDEEKEFFRSRRTPSLPIPRRSLDQTLWVRSVFSRAESVHVGEVFQTLYQAIGTYLEGRDAKELGLKKKDELDLSQKTIFTAVFNRVSQLLGIPAPKVYLSDRSFGIRIEATVPPVLIIGKDMLHGKSEKELAFLIAKNLTYFHPMHVLAACYPAPVLKLFYQVALKHVQPDVQVDGGDSEQFKVLMQHLQRRISPQLGTTLANSINHFFVKGTRPGVSRWLTGLELTANHAGLLACLDLEVAASVLRQESIAFSKLPPREKAKELVLYAVSEEFAEAREALSLKLS